MIYTGTGDDGRTWIGRMRVDKDCEFVELVGDLDEVVSLLGTIVAEHRETLEYLEPVMRALMDISSYIGTGGDKHPDADTSKWEEMINDLWEEAGPLNRFILWFSDPVAAKIHYARSVLRRAERSYVNAMKAHAWLDKDVLRLLNRLSDYLFALARALNRKRGGEEMLY